MTHTVVDRVSQCRSVVTNLLSDDVISVDAEGVNLGKEGPLTLLQVGRADGHVYLFDILTGSRDLFTVGRLKELLESEKVLKVMHGSSNDSVALHSQFDVHLNNVFDIQIAQMTCEKHQGRLLPSRKKLCDLCSIYLDDVSMLDKKDDIQIKWDKTEGEYWAKRPMTTEMIDYACADIRLLIPVHNRQKRWKTNCQTNLCHSLTKMARCGRPSLAGDMDTVKKDGPCFRKIARVLKESGLLPQVQRDVQVEIRCRWDEKTREEDNANRDAIVDKIVKSMERKYHSSPNIEVINDEDEIQALKRVHVNDLEKFPPTIRALKYQMVKKEVLEIRDELEEQKGDYIPTHSKYIILASARDHPQESVQKLAKKLKEKCDEILKHDMSVKYTLSTPLKHIKVSEQRMLRGLRPKSESDRDYHPVVLKMYWSLMEEDLVREMDSFASNRADYQFREGYIKKVKFYMSGSGVPIKIKGKAGGFISDLQNAGKIPRPARGGGRGRRY